MNRRNIVRNPELRKFLANLNSIDNINRGGCGISAVAILKWIELNVGSTSGIKILYCYPYNDWENYEVVNNLKKMVLKNNNEVMLAPCHVVLQFGNHFIDSNSIRKEMSTPDCFTPTAVDIPFPELLKSINKAEWANQFDRRSNLPKISKLLGQNLSKLINV